MMTKNIVSLKNLALIDVGIFNWVINLKRQLQFPTAMMTLSYHILCKFYAQRVPALRAFWDLGKTVLHEIRVSGTVVGPLLTRKFPTCTHISQKPW